MVVCFLRIAGTNVAVARTHNTCTFRSSNLLIVPSKVIITIFNYKVKLIWTSRNMTDKFKDLNVYFVSLGTYVVLRAKLQDRQCILLEMKEK